MYHRFIEQISEFIFAEDEPEKADIIFIPGNGYSQMAEKAAALYGENYASFVLPSGKYSITVGKFGGVYRDRSVITAITGRNGIF